MGEGIDCDDMRGRFIPGAVFTPIGGTDFFPAVIERVGGRKDSHCMSENWLRPNQDPRIVLRAVGEEVTLAWIVCGLL